MCFACHTPAPVNSFGLSCFLLWLLFCGVWLFFGCGVCVFLLVKLNPAPVNSFCWTGWTLVVCGCVFIFVVWCVVVLLVKLNPAPVNSFVGLSFGVLLFLWCGVCCFACQTPAPVTLLLDWTLFWCVVIFVVWCVLFCLSNPGTGHSFVGLDSSKNAFGFCVVQSTTHSFEARV